MPPAAGAVNVCATELSPLKAAPLPTIAEAVPLWAVLEIAVLPERAQPVKPLSNPPLLMPLDTVTVSVTVVVCVALLAVPVTVTEYDPAAVAAPTPSVSVELPPDVIVLGLNVAVVPTGRPLALRLTLWGAPLVTAVAIVDVALPPCAAETLLGLALIEKSDARTVKVSDVVWLALEAAPVTVTV